MRTIILTALILVIALGGYAAYFVTAQLPKLAQEQAQKTIQDMGFEGVQLAQPDIRINAARFKKIILDKEGISTINSIEVHYSPFWLLVMRGPSVVKIDGLNLVGELLETQTIDIAGWNGKSAKLNLQNGNLHRLVIQNSRLSLLTDNWGGVNIDYGLQMRTRGKQVDIQGHVRSQQKHINIVAGAKGFINRDGLWQAELEMTQGKFDIAPVKATRVNGNIKISGKPGALPAIVAELQAGGTNIHGFPWQNASSTFEGTPKDFKIFADMKSVGYPGVELGLNIQKQDEELSISGTAHGETLAKLADYLEHREALFFDKAALASLAHISGLTLEFQTNDTPDSHVAFTLSDAQQKIKIRGAANIEEQKLVSANISSNAFFLSHLESLITPDNTNLDGGHIKVSGTINDTESILKADVVGGALTVSPLRLEKITGTFVVDDAQTLSAKAIQALKCGVPLKIKHSCSISLDMKNGALKLSEIKIDALDGTLSINDYTPTAPPHKLTLQGTNIDFWSLSEALDLEGLDATGAFKIDLPLHKEGNQLIIRGGTIRNEGKGVIRYLYEDNPAFFEGDEFELETMKQALTNYHYEFLEMRISGPVEAPDVFVVGRGYNPDMFDHRPIALNFKTKAKTSALLKNILR